MASFSRDGSKESEFEPLRIFPARGKNTDVLVVPTGTMPVGICSQ